jgi:hypothetical protein
MSGHRSGPPEAANRRSWTAECAYLPIRLTCNLRTVEVMPVARILTKECPHVDETRILAVVHPELEDANQGDSP